jgi:hypothetical protein
MPLFESFLRIPSRHVKEERKKDEEKKNLQDFKKGEILGNFYNDT